MIVGIINRDYSNKSPTALSCGWASLKSLISIRKLAESLVTAINAPKTWRFHYRRRQIIKSWLLINCLAGRKLFSVFAIFENYGVHMMAGVAYKVAFLFVCQKVMRNQFQMRRAVRNNEWPHFWACSKGAIIPVLFFLRGHFKIHMRWWSTNSISNSHLFKWMVVAFCTHSSIMAASHCSLAWGFEFSPRW